MISVELKKISKVYLLFDKKIRIYFPIHGNLTVLVNSHKTIIEEEKFFLLNQYQLGLFYPDFKQADNLVFEIILDPNPTSKDNRSPTIFNNFFKNLNIIDKPYVLKSIDSIYQKNIDENELKNFYKKALNFLETKELLIDQNRLPFDNELIIIKSYYESLLSNPDMINTNMDNLANLYKVSSAYFSKTFKRVSGFNLSEFKQLFRLNQASELLIKTNNSLDEIANIIGYQSTKSLYDVFNNTIELLPYQYKKIVLDSISNETRLATDSNTYIKYKDKLSSVHYSNLYKAKNSYVNHDINLNNHLEKFRYRGINIYDLSSIGEDYLNNLVKINKDIKINYVLLDIYLNKNFKDLIYLKNSKVYMTKSELLILLELLNTQQIHIGISIEVSKDSFPLYNEEDYKQIKEFQNYILSSIPYRFRSHYEWLISLPNILDQENINSYIQKRVSLLQSTFGPNIKLSAFIGDINRNDLYKLEKFIIESSLNSIFNQIYFNIIYNLDLKGIENKNHKYYYNKISYDFKSVLKDINKMRSYINITVAHFIVESYECVNNLFSDNTLIYADLIINYIYADNLAYIQDHIMYFILFEKKTKRKYKPTLMRDRYLKTPTYFLLEYLSKLKGQIIKSREGVIAIKNEEDINLIIMNNLYLDYVFADQRNYNNISGEKRKLKINLYPIYGTYKVTKNIINSYYGNPLRRLDDFNTGGVLSQEDRDYINSVNFPYRKVDLIAPSYNYKFNLELEAFSIVCMQLHRM